MNENTRAVTLIKGKERYIFVFDLKYKPEVLRTIGQFASDPELSFNWHDAAVLSQRVRQKKEIKL
jgi:hypothetical protein